MKNDAGNLSIDFLAGFTIFMIAFIWVATMIPGLLMGITGSSIDFDAVAYRTGVILVEDPGMPTNPEWENYRVSSDTDDKRDSILRMGLAISKDYPNILSMTKIDTFFDPDFSYPDDYQDRLIFGDHHYRFNISVVTLDNSTNKAVGDIRPYGNYGYIRRVVMVKQMSNATINATRYESRKKASRHVFAVTLNMTRLIRDEKYPSYQIDALTEPILINVTRLRANLSDKVNTQVRLVDVKIYRLNPTPPLIPVWVPPSQNVTIDGGIVPVKPPVIVNDNITLRFPAGFFNSMASWEHTIFINFTFTLSDKTTGNSVKDFFVNTTGDNAPYPFYYDYDPRRVTQPRLEPGIVEVAVW